MDLLSILWKHHARQKTLTARLPPSSAARDASEKLQNSTRIVMPSRRRKRPAAFRRSDRDSIQVIAETAGVRPQMSAQRENEFGDYC